tara:strand:+ start:3487 stop:4017 length:531 start_codon:yes stop_codon:yes gene_type:complete
VNYKFITREETSNYCSSIIAQMMDDKFKPDVLLTLLWGGVIPTRIFMDLYDMDRHQCFASFASSYTGIGKKGNVKLSHPFSPEELKGKNVLILDDIWDSGDTLVKTIKSLEDHVNSVKTACIVTKETYRDLPISVQISKTCPYERGPDYFGDHVAKSTWVVFDWEKNEFLRDVNAK